ncbi:MAG: CRTAC1 family protein [Acidobacteriota bacterium]|nr:CRTAC1 family protein [Blastocatellia bacterium]MDW8412443.1 CRTAC1 family protein [Acidobacteriota bacterium]
MAREERRSAATVEVAASASTSTTTQHSLAPVTFVDVTAEAGLNFRHVSGAFGKKYLPETMGSGCAFLDYNGDGWQDIFLVNSTSWPERKGLRGYLALYRNDRNGRFTDVTEETGLKVELYGMGVAAGDYDNDGDVDIYVTALGQDRLFRNNGGSFEDVTLAAGIVESDFGTSAAWLDYDRDGLLDLFVCNYVEWSVDKDLFCTLDGKTKSYCKPESYKGQSPRLYRNLGEGRFQDVTAAAGLKDATCKALGVTVLDYDRDGWPDIFVANDTEPNKLYHNERDGKFSEQGVAAGVAFSEAGLARAGMGTDAADYDASGYPSLIVGNFSNEMLAVYHNEGTGLFIDEAPTSNIGRATLLSLTFGCFFFDYDLDGREDIFLANGHVADDINKVQPKITYAQPPKLFRNLGRRQFEDKSRSVGEDFSRPLVARGAAYGDYDNDGDLDILISCNNGRARLYRNEFGNQNNSIKVKTIGTKSTRDGIGAVVTVKLEDGTLQWKTVKTGSSYCSQSELPVTFGLGRAERVALVEVKWPSGRVDQFLDLTAGRMLVIKEGEGIVSTIGFTKG